MATILYAIFIFFGFVFTYCIGLAIYLYVRMKFMVRDRRDGKYYWKSEWKKRYADNSTLLEWAKY